MQEVRTGKGKHGNLLIEEAGHVGLERGDGGGGLEEKVLRQAGPVSGLETDAFNLRIGRVGSRKDDSQ